MSLLHHQRMNNTNLELFHFCFELKRLVVYRFEKLHLFLEFVLNSLSID